MQLKKSIYLRMLEKYGFMIDNSGNSPIAITHLPAANEKETLKQWKQRVFKDASADISVYTFYEPAPQTRISTLMRDSGGEHLNKIFRHYGRLKDKRLMGAIGKAKQETSDLYSTFPKETLYELLYELENELQPSVKEFFDRHIESTEENLGIERLLKELISAYNQSVAAYKTKEAYIDKCIKYREVPTSEQN